MPAQTPEQIHRLFEAAFNAGDVDALMDLYEPEAVLVVQPGQTVAGLDRVREALGGFLAIGGPLSLATADVVQGGDLALMAGRWTLSGTGPDGQPVTLGAVSAEVARRGADGAWRYVLDNPWGPRGA